MKSCISIIIPVLNEADVINHTAGHVLSLAHDTDVEVIVVDGSHDGETISVINDDRVKKAVSEKGRARQMNKGASIAKGDILLFLHADTRLPGSALQSISALMQDGTFACGAFSLGIDSARPIYRIIEKVVSLRQKITGIPYGDQAIFVRKDYFDAVGGFREMPLMEDVEFARRIKKAGGKICIIPDKVRTSARKWEEEGVLYCTLRNWALVTLYILGVKPERLVKFYYKA